MRRFFTLLILMFLPAFSFSHEFTLAYIDTKTDASFRGMSVTEQGAIWVSGSKGWIGRSTNGGADWTFSKVPGYETLDFRTIYAFDSNNAIIANAGSPAYILRTGDGGISWKRVYENPDSAAFIDGVDFRNNKHGIIYGDPINGRMLLLYTRDGGRTWDALKNSPFMNKGEASFAASGTNIRYITKKTIVIATGGKESNLYMSHNRGRDWQAIPTPMLSGKESTGIFSFMPTHYIWKWFIAGGDYRNDTVRTANFFYSADEGKSWQAPQTTTRGYRECLAVLYEGPKKGIPKAMFAVGPSGIDISTDYGVNWKPFSDEKGFHVIKPFWPKLLFLAGSNGKLAVIKATN